MRVPRRFLRRLMRRYGVRDDALRHFDTFGALGRNADAEIPFDMVPSAALTLFRAIRSRSAFQLADGWVWPWWLERQADPASPDFIPRGHLPVLANVTHRTWTAVGTVSAPDRGTVDPRGLVTPDPDGFSLDWWIGAEDRWHLPSREVAVRQRLLDDMPVIETRMKIPGGDAVHRAYVVRGGPEVEGVDLVVVEVENDSPTPVALAFSVRPYGPEGLAVVEAIAAAEDAVMVDGRPAVLLPRAPAHGSAGNLERGDVSAIVTSGEAGRWPFDPVHCPAGLAQAAMVYPLAHRTTVRVLLPLAPMAGTARPRFDAVPAAASVADGWRAQTARGLRVELPDAHLQSGVTAARAHLLLFHQGATVTPGPATYDRFYFRDGAFLLGALGRFGFHDEVAEVLATYPDLQRGDGYFLSQDQEWDANGAALFALADHWRLARREGFVEPLVDTVALGAHWIDRARGRSRDRDRPGLLPPGVSAEHLGPPDQYYWDNFWSLRGLRDAADLLVAAGRPQALEDLDVSIRDYRRDVEASLEADRARLGTAAMPASPNRLLDGGAVGNLVACRPLGLFAADDPRVVETLRYLQDHFCHGEAYFHAISHTGLGTYLTMHLAFAELASGDPTALRRLAWMVEVASPTWTWPEAINPRTGGGCMGDGHHGWATAEFLWFVRDLLVREVPGGLELMSMVPDAWLGQPLEVHDAPTEHGQLSYALRWHGERPALLWELEPHAGSGPVTLRAPGLDPSWSSTERRGEELLAPVAPPDTDAVAPPPESGFV